MKKLITFGVCIIAVIGFAYLLLGQNTLLAVNKGIEPKPSIPAPPVDPHNVITTTASEPLTIPMYPGGNQPQIENIPEWSKVIFQTSDPIEKVLQFYKTALPGQGWTLTSETTSVPGVGFSWRDGKKIASWKLDLDIYGTLSKQAGQVEISLLVTRFPEPSRIALYNDAQDISRWMFTTTYMSKAKPEVIEEFYKDTLPKDGWKLDPSSSSIDSQGLLFVWLRPAKESDRIDGGNVVIKAKVTSDGRTEVKLSFGGDPVEP